MLETRGARQNVAIQAIMQSRAKMNLSPTSSVSSTHSSGRDAGLEKSKSEPIMIVNQPDLLLAKLMAKNGGDVSQVGTLHSAYLNTSHVIAHFFPSLIFPQRVNITST